MAQTFRFRLRSETRQAHEAVDDAFGAHDLSTSAGYVAFLGAHEVALAALAAQPELPRALLDWIAQDRARIARDLTVLRARAVPAQLPNLPPCHPLAVEYILRGSKMGLRMLWARWNAAQGTRAGATDHFLSNSPPDGSWRAFCTRLDQIPPNSSAGNAIIRDSIEIFGLYTKAAHTPCHRTEAA